MHAEDLSLGDEAELRISFGSVNIRIKGEIIEFIEGTNGIYAVIEPSVGADSVAGPIHRVRSRTCD